jgi:DNA processing protein
MHIVVRDDWRHITDADELPEGLERLTGDLAVRELWVCGRSLPPPRLGIVGTRSPDHGGLATASLLAREAAFRGWAVVSGGALGIDASAHEGCLMAGGGTLSVSAAPAGSTYPPSNARLFDALVRSGGALVTESPPGARIHRASFLRRNRIIAALSDVLVVVQARVRSGALSTARWARSIGVPVLAACGSPLNPLHGGTNRLVATGGAAPLLSVSHPFGREPDGGTGPPLRRGGEEGAVLRLLSTEPVDTDELAALAEMSSRRLTAVLLDLELEGAVERTAQGRYVRVPGRTQRGRPARMYGGEPLFRGPPGVDGGGREDH